MGRTRQRISAIPSPHLFDNREYICLYRCTLHEERQWSEESERRRLPGYIKNRLMPIIRRACPLSIHTTREPTTMRARCHHQVVVAEARQQTPQQCAIVQDVVRCVQRKVHRQPAVHHVAAKPIMSTRRTNVCSERFLRKVNALTHNHINANTTGREVPRVMSPPR